MTFKPKSITEKLFTKENVFQWIETLEEAVIVLDRLSEVCDDNQKCENCPFGTIPGTGCAVQHHCGRTAGNKVQPSIEAILRNLYKTVEENKWEDEDENN